jgi:hypothetical protein
MDQGRALWERGVKTKAELAMLQGVERRLSIIILLGDDV